MNSMGLLVLIVSMVIPILIVTLALVMTRRNQRRLINEQIQRLSNAMSVCPVCGSTEGTWGVAAGQTFLRFMPLGKMGMGKGVVALRCDTCGHLMFFSEPPAQVKRKRQPTEGFSA